MTAAKRPVYFRLLRIRHLNARPWVTFVLFEGSIAVGVLLALADIVSQWGVIAVPVAVAAMVKLNDVVAAAQAEPLAAAQLRTPRLPAPAAVGRSPVPRPTARLPRSGVTVSDSGARGVATVPARRPTPRRDPLRGDGTAPTPRGDWLRGDGTVPTPAGGPAPDRGEAGIGPSRPPEAAESADQQTQPPGTQPHPAGPRAQPPGPRPEPGGAQPEPGGPQTQPDGAASGPAPRARTLRPGRGNQGRFTP